MTKYNLSKKVIITGANGFVGQHLVPLLLDNNYEVVAIIRDHKKVAQFDWRKDVKCILLDFHKEDKLPMDVRGWGLIHAAWQGLPNYKKLFHLEENLPFSYRFIKSLVVSGVNKVLVTGTCSEYGYQNGKIPSTTKPIPNTPYGAAKDQLRQQLEYLATVHPFCFQWARLFYMYGKGQNPNSVLSQLDAAIDKNDAVFNMSEGEQLRDYLPIEKLAKQLLDLYSSGYEGVCNICSGKPISVRRLVEQRISESNSKIALNLGYYSYLDYEPMAFWGVRDISDSESS